MAGEYVPLVMMPRFTTYIGEATFETVALDVSEFEKLVLSVWRGPLLGNTGSGASLEITFETSDDNEHWAPFPYVPAITTAGGTTVVEVELLQRFLRSKVVLTKDGTDLVALTCWAAGHLDRRES